MKVKEIIVVEGKDDTTAIKRAVNADTIETNGSAVSPETIEKIKLAQQKRGVIIFTDPDYPGERIRTIISQRVPGCKHAFLPKHQAKPKHGKGIGIEHAAPEYIRAALADVHEEMEELKEQISANDLVMLGLIGESRSKARRIKLGEQLKIGYTNGKQLQKRLRMFQISREDFMLAIEGILQEEKDE